MHVVTAGVHDARVFGGEGQARLFLERKGVVVAAERDAIAIGVDGAAEDGHAARFADAGVRMEAHFAQAVGDEGHGAEFLLGQFRMAVQPAAPLNDLRIDAVRNLFYLINHLHTGLKQGWHKVGGRYR